MIQPTRTGRNGFGNLPTAALREAVRISGSLRALARQLNVSHQAIAAWDQVPAERVRDVERITGVSRHRLRPDLYWDEHDGGQPTAPPDVALTLTSLQRVARRTASRAIHSLLAQEPDLLSNHDALLLERRIATFLSEELTRAMIP